MGCKSSKTITQLNNNETALLEVKMCRDKIKKYIKSLETNAGKRRELAKEALKSKNRDGAKRHLRLAKMFEEQIKSADGKLSMLEDQIHGIETAMNLSEVKNALEAGNKTLKELQKEVNVEKFQEIADEMAEIKEEQDEVANFFKEKGYEQEEYEGEIDGELGRLQEKMNKELGLDLPTANDEKIEVDKEQNIEKTKKVAVEA